MSLLSCYCEQVRANGLSLTNIRPHHQEFTEVHNEILRDLWARDNRSIDAMNAISECLKLTSNIAYSDYILKSDVKVYIELLKRWPIFSIRLNGNFES
jgi:hypothetical protein